MQARVGKAATCLSMLTGVRHPGSGLPSDISPPCRQLTPIFVGVLASCKLQSGLTEYTRDEQQL